MWLILYMNHQNVEWSIRSIYITDVFDLLNLVYGSNCSTILFNRWKCFKCLCMKCSHLFVSSIRETSRSCQINHIRETTFFAWFITFLWFLFYVHIHCVFLILDAEIYGIDKATITERKNEEIIIIYQEKTMTFSKDVSQFFIKIMNCPHFCCQFQCILV